jgi:N-acetylglutamate synthase-like GNAT family acetyltransferase
MGGTIKMKLTVRIATLGDIVILKTFLETAQLNTKGINEMIDSFLIMEDEDGQLKATIGMEQFGASGLLRSLVVTASTSENDLLSLFEEMFLLAKNKEIKDLYLATNKLGAMKFVEVLGFEPVDKDQIPMAFLSSEHVKHILTVDNSVFLKHSIL